MSFERPTAELPIVSAAIQHLSTKSAEGMAE